MHNQQFSLRYGINPQQVPARIYTKAGKLPIRILNGAPSYINLLDAFNSWQLVRELRNMLHMPAATCFKHVSPAGAAVGIPLDDTLRRAYFVDDLELSPLATAYARARGADRVSSFGDWVALSDVVDTSTASLLQREVSDGIIAPAFEQEALEILCKKRSGKYVVIEIDADYQPGELETRDVFGVMFEQKRNDLLTSPNMLRDIVTRNQDLPEHAKRDMLVALVTLKYTQSNSVCLALNGQIIGIGAGQQSRIHCTRLAASKADAWFLRQHPTVLALRFRSGLRRPERDNAIDQYLREDLTPQEQRAWEEAFDEIPIRLTSPQKLEWLDNFKGVSLNSDGYIPFRDSIDRSQQSGVTYVVQPGGSMRDSEVIKACDEYGMVMVFTGVRFFHH